MKCKKMENLKFGLALFVTIVFAFVNMVYLSIYVNEYRDSKGRINPAQDTDRIQSNSTNASLFIYQRGPSPRDRISILQLTPEYHLHTPFCKIPKTEIMPPYYRQNWRLEQIPNCSYETRLAEVGRDLVLRILPEHQHKYCCLYEITRVEGDNGEDDIFRLTECKKVNSQFKTRNIEMYVLQCDKSLNFEANLPIHANVRKKLKYWKTKRKSEKKSRQKSSPINVLLIGIDSTSRSHAYRSLPKTLEHLTNMGFHDFQAYHSVAPSTLTNFMAFLMGLKRTEVRETCTSNWTSPFDPCPFIWKVFSEQKYVTMFIEDNTQTFNWGGQSGFREKPTDYYIHALFNAVEWIRKNNGTNTPDDYCTSNETVPQFVTRYTRRFLETFKNTPFFSFTWFAHPFHSKPFTLGTMDDDLLTLFDYIKSEPLLLRNTLIILLSDHGLREWEGDFYNMNPMDSYIERGLPLFFIRVPERLREMYPEMKFDEIMERNSKQLTSPFDVHHTLLELLSLTGLCGNSTFDSVLVDRSSLFRSIQDSDSIRNCEALNIVPHLCVCNAIPGMEPLQSPFYLGRLARLVEHKLEKYVKMANYSSECADWIVRTGDIKSLNVMIKTENFTNYLVVFSANPGNARFLATVQVVHIQSPFDYGLVGEVSRLNSYGTAGACIGNSADQEKELKAFCTCNSEVVEPKYGF